jgi:O-antigen/teichoic acid export membrane protein
MFARVISIIPALMLCLKFTKINLVPNFDGRILKNMLKYSLPLIPAGISLWGINSLNRIFMVRYLTLDQVGLFSIASKFVALMTISIIGFQLAWPQFAFSNMHDNNSSRIFSRAFGYFVAFELWLVLFLTLFAGQLLKLAATPQYYGATNIVFPLSLGMFLYGIFYFFTTNSIITKSTLKIIPSIVAALLVNIILNAFITPKYGYTGTAWVTVFTYLAMASTMALFSKAYEYILLEWSKVLRLLTTAGIFIAMALILLDKSGPYWIGVKTAVFLVFPAALVWIGIINIGNIKADFSACYPVTENNNIMETKQCVELPVD